MAGIQVTRIGVKDRIAKPAIIAICFGLLGPFQTMILCREIKQNQPQDCKTIFETLSLPVTKILSSVARQAPTKFLGISRKFVDISQISLNLWNSVAVCCCATRSPLLFQIALHLRGAPSGVATLKVRKGAFDDLNKGSGALGK